MQVQSLSPKDPLEEGMEIHSSILAWKIPWTEESGRLHSMGWQRVGHNLAWMIYEWGSTMYRLVSKWILEQFKKKSRPPREWRWLCSQNQCGCLLWWLHGQCCPKSAGPCLGGNSPRNWALPFWNLFVASYTRSYASSRSSKTSYYNVVQSEHLVPFTLWVSHSKACPQWVTSGFSAPGGEWGWGGGALKETGSAGVKHQALKPGGWIPIPGLSCTVWPGRVIYPLWVSIYYSSIKWDDEPVYPSFSDYIEWCHLHNKVH